MRHTLLSLFAAACLSVSACSPKEIPVSDVIEYGLETARFQAACLADSLLSREGRLPRTFEDNSLVTEDYHWWTAGFFPGVLWQLFDDCREDRFLEWARIFTDRVEPAKRMTDTHDLGFMLYCSFGQGYHLTGDRRYVDVIKEGTASLMTRWNPEIGVIKSWESSERWKYPVIIDNMMNLEMLCFVSEITGDPSFREVAMKHADTTLKNHFRENGSTWHVVSYDPETGVPHAKNTAQGYSDDSSWARGQAWALYGYTMMYRETGQTRYLDQARKVADLLVHHPNLPEDGIPYWDYDAPDIPDAVRDASAAAVMASALIELSTLDTSSSSSLWLETAVRQIRSLTSPEYLAEPGTNGGFILKHSTGSFPAGSEVDVPLTYADYYYVEALLRLKALISRPEGAADRASWVDGMVRIAGPVLENLAAGTLKSSMPFESISTDPDRRKVSYLEAVGRTLCGIAPWLELGPDDTDEGKLREKYIGLTLKGLANAVDTDSPDCLDFFNPVHRQPLVDAAFLAEGLLRAPTQVWGRLDARTQERLVECLKSTRQIEPYPSNWLLFSSIIEAFLLEATGEYDAHKLYDGVESFRDRWYKGDGWYGDGASFHLDYYNSLVIHPMLTEVLRVMAKHGLPGADFLPEQEARHGRMAAQLERMISPEGTFPVVGRSIAYRFGALHALSDAALLHILPYGLSPSAVRCGMTAVLDRQLGTEGNFDADGWLSVGFSGNQKEISEDYINTGSCYLCLAFFLPLGLPSDDPFWAGPPKEWTGRLAWRGAGVRADKAL